MRTKKYNEWLREGFEFKPDSSDNYLYSRQKLTSLVGAPERVDGDFYCGGNMLTSLKGAPESVDGNFNCSRNSLTTLKGAPKRVGGGFSCSSNSLTSLVGAPESVGRAFYCGSNMLTTLKGAPESVGGDFYCDSNMLTTLVGAPESVDGNFYCHNNMLTTLEGAPEKIVGNFSCNEFTIDRGKWGIEGWLEVLQTGTDKAKSLILTLLSEDELDKYFTEDPMRLHLLDLAPDLKAGVLKRTGLKDLSRLGRNLKQGLL